MTSDTATHTMSRYWELVEPVWESISIYDGPETFLAQFRSYPTTQTTLFAAHWCQSEVKNGGFSQFFTNSTGVLAPEAAAAFAEIGMPRTSSVIQRAIALFGDDYPRDRDDRAERLDEIDVVPEDDWGPLETLDSEFYALIDTEAGGFREAADRYADTRSPKDDG